MGCGESRDRACIGSLLCSRFVRWLELCRMCIRFSSNAEACTASIVPPVHSTMHPHTIDYRVPNHTIVSLGDD